MNSSTQILKKMHRLLRRNKALKRASLELGMSSNYLTQKCKRGTLHLNWFIDTSHYLSTRDPLVQCLALMLDLTPTEAVLMLTK